MLFGVSRVGVSGDGERPTIFAPAVRNTTLGLLVIITLIAFEAMAVSAALPTAARDLHGLGSYGLAFTGFLVAEIVGMVVAGQLSDRRGPARPLAAGLIVFIGGLVLAGSATTMAQLIAGRVVQGLGAGLIITAVYVVIGQVYSDALRPKVFAATSSAWVVPSLVGPLVSGVLAQHATWRLVFLGLVPFTLLGAALTAPTLRALHRDHARTTERTSTERTSAERTSAEPTSAGHASADARQLLRALAVAVGAGGLGLVAEHPSPAPLASTPVLLVLLVWGLRALLPPGTGSARPGVSAPIALRGLLAAAFFGVESLVPLSLSVQHHYSATVAGLPLAVSGVSWSLGSWWQGRAVAEDGTARRVRLIRTGFALLAAGIAGMAVTALPAVPGWLAYPSWMLSGLGMGLTMSSLAVILLRFTSAARRGADSAALQLSDATASAVSTGIGGMLVAAAARGAIGYTGAFVILDVAMCAVALLGVSIAGRARPADARGAVAAAGIGVSI